jgi:hypothetical protein
MFNQLRIFNPVLPGLLLSAILVGCSTTPVNENQAFLEQWSGMTSAQQYDEARRIDDLRRAQDVVQLKKGLTPFEQQWGIKVLGITRTSAGYMLDFRYKVLDTEKATPILQRKFAKNPYLIAEKTGAKMGVPFTEKVGSVRSSVRSANQIKAGRKYAMIFVNPAKHILRGDLVTIVIGDFKLEHLEVI